MSKTFDGCIVIIFSLIHLSTNFNPNYQMSINYQDRCYFFTYYHPMKLSIITQGSEEY